MDMTAETDLTVPEQEGAIAERALRLRQAVKAAGGNAAVSRSSGLPLNTLNRYLAGRDMKAANLIALAEATGVSLDWLATGRGSPQAISMPQTAVERKGNTLEAAQGTVLISRYDARAAAGVPMMMHHDSVVIEQIAFSESWIRTVLRRDPANLAIMEATGDSMRPTIDDGDALMIDVSVNEVHSARIYVLDLDGALVVKRVQRLFDGSFKVISDNPRYDDEIVRPNERNPLLVVGEVVWHAGLMRS